MKKIFLSVLAFCLLIPSMLYAAGACSQTSYSYTGGFVHVVLVCTGDASNGSIPDTAISTAIMNTLLGVTYLYIVSAYPTAGGTAPDAADVQVVDANGEDLLGGKGANLIHATAKQTVFPYSAFQAENYAPAVINALTLKVANQSTASANYTIELVFAR